MFDAAQEQKMQTMARFAKRLIIVALAILLVIEIAMLIFLSDTAKPWELSTGFDPKGFFRKQSKNDTSPDGDYLRINDVTEISETKRIQNNADDTMNADEILKHETICKKYPDCVVIGFPRCGVVPLLKFLDMHPKASIIMNPNKAFDAGVNFNEFTEKDPCLPPLKTVVQRLSNTGRPENVYSVNKDMKIILAVRDPVDRAISHYSLLQGTDKETGGGTFEEAVLPRLTVKEHGPVLTAGMYSFKLEPWMGYFRKEQFFIVNSTELVSDPVQVLQNLEKFLRLEPYVTQDHFTQDKETGLYCKTGEYTSGCVISSFSFPKPQVNSSTITQIQSFYKKYNEDFFQMFGERFDWNDQKIRKTSNVTVV